MSDKNSVFFKDLSQNIIRTLIDHYKNDPEFLEVKVNSIAEKMLVNISIIFSTAMTPEQIRNEKATWALASVIIESFSADGETVYMTLKEDGVWSDWTNFGEITVITSRLFNQAQCTTIEFRCSNWSIKCG